MTSGPWGWAAGTFGRGVPAEPVPFGLLETMAAVAGGVPLWPHHRARLAAGAARLGWPAPPAELPEATADLLARNGHTDGVLRLVLTPHGELQLTSRARGPDAPVVLLPVLARRPDDAPPPDLKTSDRRHYDAALAEARAGGADDGVLLGDGGAVLETAVGNLWLLLDGAWVTPPADGSLLAGVARGLLLGAGSGSGVRCAERRCELADLHRASALAVSNAVHGVRPAALRGSAASAAVDELVRRWRRTASA